MVVQYPMFNLDLDVIKSQINKNSEIYIDNYQKMSILVEQLDNELKKSLYQGEEKILARFKKDNRLPLFLKYHWFYRR